MADFVRIPKEAARALAELAARFLAADPRVRLVFLFGSTAAPDRPSVRDVDLAVLTDPMDFWDLMRLRADATLAARGEFDLVWLNEAPPVLAREVTFGECLYTDPPELETEFVTRTQMKYLDWKWYLDEQYRISGERLEDLLNGLPT
jgi:predicted nucleotidyltransferase